MKESYEDSLEKVKNSVARLEKGELSLEESIEVYSEGLQHLKECYEKLNTAEKKLEELSGSIDDISVDDTEIS